MSSLKISQITTCRAHVQLVPWLLKFRSCPDESDIFETAVQSGLKAPSTRIWEKKISGFKNVRIRSAWGLHFGKKLILRRYQYRYLFYDVLFQNNDSKICHIYRSYEERWENSMFKGEWFLQRITLRVLRVFLRFKS